MILARVVGNVWSTRKEELLCGLKFLIVQPLNVNFAKNGKKILKTRGDTIIAADRIGAGNSEIVMLVSGSSARQSLEDNRTPIDTMIVGIIDKETFEIDF